jgi:wobble nucleotide-excising tRNase
MEDELNGSDHERLIIYIDDPISSLDNNHIFFMFSLIETVIARDKKYGQLFISTHNLDFLKYIKRLTIARDNQNRELINHFIVEKRKKNNDSQCHLLKMPLYLKDYVTEYNFLFREIYKMAIPFTSGSREKCYENNFTLFYNLPNNMRRFLECYLFYRYPNTDSPLRNLEKIFDGNVPALVKRVIHEYSHLTWGDRGTLVMDVSEAETVAKEIMRAIREKDREHFDALCQSIGMQDMLQSSEKNITIKRNNKSKNIQEDQLSLFPNDFFPENNISPTSIDI